LKSFLNTGKNTQLDIFDNKIELEGGSYFVKDDLQSALSFLYSPFEEKKTLVDVDVFFNSDPVLLDFNYDTLKIAESIHSFNTVPVRNEQGVLCDLSISMKMEIKPWFIERIHQTELGKVLYQSYRLTHNGYNDLLKKYSEKFTTSLTEEILLSELLRQNSRKLNRYACFQYYIGLFDQTMLLRNQMEKSPH